MKIDNIFEKLLAIYLQYRIGANFKILLGLHQDFEAETKQINDV